MRAVLQRVTGGWVEVVGECFGRVGPGWLVLLGVRVRLFAGSFPATCVGADAQASPANIKRNLGQRQCPIARCFACSFFARLTLDSAA